MYKRQVPVICKGISKKVKEGQTLTLDFVKGVVTDGDTAVGGADLDVQAGIGHGVADLVKGTARSEHGEAGHEGDIAHGGQTGGNAHHDI